MAFTEDFNSYSDGAVAGNNGGSGFAAAWVDSYQGSYSTVQGTYLYEGAKGLLLGASGTSVKRQFSSDISGTLVFYVAVGARQTSGDSTKGCDVTLRNTSDAGIITVRIDKVDSWGTEGHIQLLGKVGGTVTAVDLVSSYTANVAYLIEVTVNMTTGAVSARYTTDAYGTPSGSVSWSTPVTCDVLNSGSARYINPNKDTTTKQYFVDYISDTAPFSTATNVTVSPSAVAATFSVQSPTPSGAANVAPSVLASTFSTQAPAISGGASVAPNALTATFSIPAPNIITPDAQVDVSALSASFSVQSPTASGNADVGVSVLTATFSQPAASFVGDVSITPDAQVATFNLQAPTITAIGNVTVSASVLEATFNLQSPTVSAEQNAMIDVGVLTATFSIPTPTVTAIRNVSVDVSVLSAAFSVQAPTKVGGLWTAQPRAQGTWTPQPRAV